MSRGGPMGGRGGFHPGMRGRGILRGVPPRGMGFHHRGGPPRGGGPPSRGRPTMYNTPPHHQNSQPHQHQSINQGSSSQPPPPADGTPPTVSTTSSSQAPVKPTGSGSGPPSTGPSASGPPSSSTNGAPSGPPNGPPASGLSSGGPPSRGAPRGRGSIGMSRGRGGYTPNINVSGGGEMSGPPQKPYRGGPPRGRGGYSQGLSRPPPAIQPGMTQGAPVPALKRGPPVGILGAKRGRYDQGGPPTRPYIPKYPSYSQQQQVPTHPPQHSSYHNPSSQIPRYILHIVFVVRP